ncbi:MAG: penicillin-binding protein 2, partial [Pseudonocardiales bacterium]|nr:penicillin-binding protein 2 [Pseudonocardiales bacterium]
DRYPCPSSLDVDGRTKTNYESESFGDIDLKFALQVSCDTFFYAPAVAEWQADQARVEEGKKPLEQLQAMARAFGVAHAPGVDLPADEQASGSIGSRESRLASWNANKADYCAAAKKGYPNVTNQADRAYLTRLASENCTDGWRFFAGNNADNAIGQGDTTVSPLQLATAYSAMVNGGTLYSPTLGWAVVDAAGKTVRTITPKVVRKVPVSKQSLDFIANSLHFEDSHSVSGALAFDQSPIKTLISGKTGTAEVYGKLDTSWLASWGPVQPGAQPSDAKFVVVGMVEQAGTGASAAAPMVRKVYDGLLGANGPAVLPGSVPASKLPAIIATRAPAAGPTASAAPALPSHSATPSASPDVLPSPSGSAGSSRSRSGSASSPSGSSRSSGAQSTGSASAGSAAASSTSAASTSASASPHPSGSGR